MKEGIVEKTHHPLVLSFEEKIDFEKAVMVTMIMIDKQLPLFHN